MHKTDSKSISSEVAGLFDKIREQAMQYGRLMEELDEFARQVARQGEQVRDEFVALKESSRETIRTIEDNSREALSTINHKAATLNELYDQLSTIEQTRRSLLELNKVLQTQKREIEKIIKTSENQIKRIAEESYLGFENKVALQFQQIKDDLHVIDTKLLGLLDLHRREMRQVQDDIDQFKNKVTETKYIVDETTKIVGTKIEEAEQRIDTKLAAAQIAIQHQIQEAMAQLPEPSSTGSDGTPAAAASRRDVDLLRDRIKNLEKNVSTLRSVSIALAVGACMLALVALLT